MQESRKFPKKAESSARERLYEFGDFSLNPQKRIALRGNEVIALTPTCFDILLALVEHSGEVLVKEELMEAVWHDTVVEEGNLNRQISTLRKVLGESPNDHRFIVTVPGRGYQFVAHVREVFGEQPTLIRREEVRSWSEAAGYGENSFTEGGAVTAAVHAPVIVRPATGAGARMRHRRFWVVALIVIAIAGIAAVYVFMHQPRPALTANDRILIADFSNSTGDTVFDDALKEALSVSLSQSPYLNILSDTNIRDTLKLMTRPVETELTGDVAREVCQRAGGKAYVTGSIAKLDTEYVVGLQAVDCATGDSIAREQVKAGNRDGVLNALDRAGTDLRRKLGESLKTVREFDTPLVEATTPSLDALRAYSLGLQADEVNDATAVPFFKRAIELDPEFASAYSAIAACYRNLGESGLARENFSKAFELRDHVSEREKLLISARYYNYVTGELQKATETYQLWIQAYPRAADARAGLGGLYGASGQFEKSIEVTREALRLDPDGGANYSNLVLAQASLDRFDDAAATYQMAIARKVEDPILKVNWFGVAFVRGDTQEMDRLMAWSAGKPEGEDNFLAAKSDTEAYHGHLKKAREFSEKAVNSALRNDEKEVTAQWKMDEALHEAEFGNLAAARTDTAAARALTDSHDTEILATLTLARIGQGAEAERLASDLEKRYPRDTLINDFWIPVIRASVQLSRNHAERAIELLQRSAPYEMASPVTWSGLGGPYYPAYLRGAADLALHRGTEATAEYQKILAHPGFMLACPLGALAHLGLARSYVVAGDTSKAKAAYQEFLTLWLDADSDIPILKQANAEFAKLH